MDEIMGLNQIDCGDKDNQTLVIQYRTPSDLSAVRAIAKKCGMKSCARVFVGKFIEVDVFVDLNYNPRRRPERVWLRIAYECLNNNPCPCPNNHRFKGAPIYRYEQGGLISPLALLGGQGQ